MLCSDLAAWAGNHTVILDRMILTFAFLEHHPPHGMFVQLQFNTLLAQLRLGEFQMSTSRWVGGNQDPIFLENLFSSKEIPTADRAGFNRDRYKNPELDRILDEAINTADRDKAVVLYRQAQEIISRDLPMFPLWYSANMVVASKTVGNIKIDGSGDWSFVRNLTVSK